MEAEEILVGGGDGLVQEREAHVNCAPSEAYGFTRSAGKTAMIFNEIVAAWVGDHIRACVVLAPEDDGISTLEVMEDDDREPHGQESPGIRSLERVCTEFSEDEWVFAYISMEFVWAQFAMPIDDGPYQE